MKGNDIMKHLWLSAARILCAALSVCLLAGSFAACGSDKDTSSAQSSTSSSDAKVEYNKPEVDPDSKYADPSYDPYASIPESSKGKTVRYATWIDHSQTEGAKVLESFPQKTGINVQLYTVSQWAYVDTLMKSIASGDIPDVYVTSEHNQAFPLTLQIGQPIDLCSSVDLNDPIWDKSMLETSKINGHTYLVNTIGSPWSGSDLVYFNKRIFEDNGFKNPAEYYADGTWTWTTMTKVLKDISALGDDYLGGIVDPEILGGSAAASFVKYDYKTATFSSGVNAPELQTTYQWYANSCEQKLISGNVVKDYGKFTQGKVGLIIWGVYGLKKTGHFKDMDPSDIGYTYLPALEDGSKGLTSSIYRMYGIIDGAPNADAAGYFLRYWLDPANYDLGNTFISPEAGKFYYDLINQSADKKYFNFDYPCAWLIGQSSGSAVFTNGVKSASSAQVNTKIQSVSNLVDQAVKAANELVQKKKDQYK